MAEVALITCYNAAGFLLLGKRRDQGTYTIPGGHLEEGEAPEMGALRELHEETGVRPISLSLLKESTNHDGLKLYCFSAYVGNAQPHSANDPDQEVASEDWKFYDVSAGLPAKIYENLHGPKSADDGNLIMQLFDLKKSTRDTMGEDLEKMAIASIPKGAPIPQTAEEQENGHPQVYDYNHVLTPEHRAAGYDLKVEDLGEGNYETRLRHNGKPVGAIAADAVVPGTIQPHSELHSDHRRMGLGTAMYEATYAHALHNKIRRVIGTYHTHAAGLVHESLARKHGLKYSPSVNDGSAKDDENYPNYDRRGYTYQIKSELAPDVAIKSEDVDEDLEKALYDHVHGTPPDPRVRFHAPNDLPHEGIGGVDPRDMPSLPGHVYRGISHAEHNYIVNTGHIKTNASMNIDRNEGTCFSDHFGDGESYTNFGSTNPARKGAPNYVLEVAHHPSIQRDPRDGYMKAKTPVPATQITRAWRYTNRLTPEEGTWGQNGFQPKAPAAPQMQKSEDEIHRLLSNPDVNERLMALKLNTCTPIHLQVASLDPDSQVHEAAINHSKFGDDQATHLMQASQDLDGHYPLAQQAALLARHDFVQPHHMAAMAKTSVGQPQNYRDAVAAFLANHPLAPDGVLRTLYLDPALNQDSRMAILGHPNAPDDALLHAFHTGMMTPEASTAAKVAAQHPRMPSHALESVVRLAIDRPGSHLLPLAEHILLTTPATKEIQDQIFLACTLNADRLDARGLLMAMLKGPSATSQMTARAMKELPPEVWGQAEPKEFGPEHLEQILHKGELRKSIDPAHLASVARASTSAGADLVDHTPDLHAHPPEIDHAVKAFHEQVLNSPKKTPGLTDKQAGLDKGVSKKKVFKAQVPGRPEPQKYLVKPYHEALTRHDKDYMKHPHQGWSELTSQALYHAGGIGHLHQHVHVSELNMGPGHEQEPAVVVHIKPNQTSAYEYGGRHYDKPDVEKGMPVRQIGIMDFLAGAQDRHDQNLMLDGATQQPLSIDNGRNYQFVAANRRGAHPYDTFGTYVNDTALRTLDPIEDPAKQQYGKPRYQGDPMHQDTLDRWTPAFDWFKENSPKIRKAFYDRLQQIKDPDVRDHLKRNFDARADWLEERADNGLDNYGLDWHKEPIPMYKPGELTDQEQRDPKFKAEVEKRQADKKAIAKAAKKKAVDSKVAYRQWLAEKPEYPKHLKALPREQQAVHPDFLKYSKESDKWFKRRPEEG